MKKKENEVTKRIGVVRLRTWTLTLALVVTLGLYLLINVGFEKTINFIDFAFMAMVQITVHCTYFPDGELYGMKDATYIANRLAYNTKASDISKKRRFNKLREYCHFEYEERKKEYIINECSAIGITDVEYDILKTQSPKEIDALKTQPFTYKVGDEDESILFLTKSKVKRLKRLLFKELPITENNPETIMSAVQNDGYCSIEDGSVKFKRKAYIKKILTSTVLALFLAFIGYKWKNGISPETFVQLAIYLTSVFATAVMSYSTGEVCQRVHKNKFYVDLSNYIDCFNEWLNVPNDAEETADEGIDETPNDDIIEDGE